MRNRAKCKLCQSIIESFHRYDYVSCKCDEISITGGNDELICEAKNWNNFTRVDDEGNEIIITVKDKEIPKLDRPNKKELIGLLDEMIKNIEKLPSHAMQLPINHYDFCSALLLLSSIFKGDTAEGASNSALDCK